MANSVASIQHPARNSWVEQLYLLYAAGQHPQSYTDSVLRLAFALLWAASALVFYLGMLLLSTLPFYHSFFKYIAGIVAVSGFPIVKGCLTFWAYYRMLHSFRRALISAYVPHNWLGIEVIVSVLCICLFARFGKAINVAWGVLLLCLHQAIWTVIVLLDGGSGHILLWPGYALTPITRAHPSLLYPLLGSLASIAWGLYVKTLGNPVGNRGTDGTFSSSAGGAALTSERILGGPR